jgi:LacI family transcriptional regulator
MKININDIAKKCDVSIATVSRALNNKGPVKSSTRAKVLQTAQEWNYKPNTIARSLSRSKTDTIGVILPELVDEFFLDIIHGIDEEAHRNNYYIMVSSSHSQRNLVETFLEFMSSGRVDGVILMEPTLSEEVTQIMKKIKRPIVFLNGHPNLEGIVSFSINNYQGAYAITNHLAGHGNNRLGIINGPENNVDAQDRNRGFRDALRDNRLELNEAFSVPGDFSAKSGYYGFIRLLSQPDKPQAIFAANDMMALGAYEAAKHHNIKIPNDIALAGFDDIFLSRLLTPRLTTVHAPIVELGSKALRYLLKMIDGEVDAKESYTEKLATGLVIGGSCGCTGLSGPVVF